MVVLYSGVDFSTHAVNVVSFFSRVLAGGGCISILKFQFLSDRVGFVAMNFWFK